MKTTNYSFIIYDIFGYFLPGMFFIFLVIIDFDVSFLINYFHEHKTLDGLESLNINFKIERLFQFLTWNTDSDFKFTTLFLLVVFCYFLGHVLAAISSFIVERTIVLGLFGFPSSNLLDLKSRNWRQKVFRRFTKAWDKPFVEKFKQVFESRFGTEPSIKDYYWLCFSDVSKKCPAGYKRVMHFLSLYGFSRNLSACFMTYIFVRLTILWPLGIHISFASKIILWCYAFAGFIMFKNYLKLFYRQCVELYYHFYALHTEGKNLASND